MDNSPLSNGLSNTIGLNAVQQLAALVAAINASFGVFVTPPATSTSTGVPGQMAYDGTYFYICTATDSWGRLALTTVF